jgi:hypothetical protein
MADVYHMHQASDLHASLREAITHAASLGEAEVAESLRGVLARTTFYGSAVPAVEAS